MKTLWLVLTLLCSLPLLACAAEKEDADLSSGILVQCGDEQVATFGDTVSKDGRYAVGWTFRAKAGKKAPAPWTEAGYDKPTTQVTLRLLEDEDGKPRQSDYRVVDGLVDLKTKRFTPWQSRQPNHVFPSHGSMLAAWSGDRQGTRYGIICNSHEGPPREDTVDLLLVVVTPEGARLVDLKPAADAAIGAYLQKRDPKDAAHYAWGGAAPDESKHFSSQAATLFKGQTLTLPFTATIVFGGRDVDAGRVSFALPQGTVTDIVSDPEARKALLQG